jgi:putative membrane protein
MWFMHDFNGWGMLLGGIWMLVFWGGIIALVIWGVNRLTKHNSAKASENPLDIAKARYARGEINKEQFEQIKKDLS